jgi:hypothetical protein
MLIAPTTRHVSQPSQAETSLLFLNEEQERGDGWYHQDGVKNWHGPFESKDAARMDRGLAAGWYYADPAGLHGPYSLDEARALANASFMTDDDPPKDQVAEM